MKRKLTKAQRLANTAAASAYRKRRIDSGLCPYCGNDTQRHGRACTACSEKARDYMFKKYRLSHDIPLNWPKSRGRPRIDLKVPPAA